MTNRYTVDKDKLKVERRLNMANRRHRSKCRNARVTKF